MHGRPMSEEFDEVLYLNANPDVRAMLSHGGIASALEHWRSTGRSEHVLGKRRSGFYEYDLVYDEETYLKNNVDVAAAVRRGAFRHGYEHWIRFGRRECAEGRRAGCFNHVSRGLGPFRVVVGSEGDILVAASDRALPPVERVTLKADGATISLGASSVSCSEELELVDRAGGIVRQRLLLFWVPAGLIPQNGHTPREISLAVTTVTGDVIPILMVNLGEREPSFPSLDSANAFVVAARRLARGERTRAALAASVSELAWSSLQVPPPVEEQPVSNMHVEHLLGIDGVGVYSCGWLLPANPDIERCRAWCLETGECVEFHETLTRTLRPDVSEAFKNVVRASYDRRFGFLTLLPLIEASKLSSCRIVIGVTPKGGQERLFPPLTCKASESFVEAAKVLLASVNPESPDFEATMTNNVSPAVDGLWNRERARKTRRVQTKTFGEMPSDPIVSVVVPIYGRSDFIKYQLSIFANDPDFKSGAIELIYFVDDPRIIDSVLQQCLVIHPMYRVPMVVSHTGENHGFSGANNLGASLARGRYLVLLNSDVMPKKAGWARELVHAYRDSAECGVLGAKLLYYDETLQHDGMVFERFPFWNDLYGNNHPGKGLPNHGEPASPPREVEAVTGACFVMETAFYRELGGLSEDFVFGDFEDSELCLRVRNSGRRVYYAPSVELYHLERQSQTLLPESGSWRWQLTVYNSWLQNRLWRVEIDELKDSPVSYRPRRSSPP
jgi:GT2 family glycosyltransferase